MNIYQNFMYCIIEGTIRYTKITGLPVLEKHKGVCVCVYTNKVRANERNFKDHLLGKIQDCLTFYTAIKSCA